MEYLNRECIDGISSESFRQQQPYPWTTLQDCLMPEAFERLRESLPDISLFERKVGVKGSYGQESRDRAILLYRPSLRLLQPWKEFVGELQAEYYQAFVRRMFGLSANQRTILTLEWSYAWQGCSVSPHCDAHCNVGTQIFYFNTEDDWNSCWGGEILILDDGRRLKAHSAPTFNNLRAAAAIDPRGNGSLLFQKTEHSWHGVRPLESPPEILRKLFIVTINVPTLQVWWRHVRGKDADGYPLLD